MNKKSDNGNESEDFSLGLGGPLYQLYLSTWLLKKPLDLYKRRMIVISLLTWLPLFLLAIIGGVGFSGVRVPFIFDIDVHVRFLCSLSLLILAEVIAHKRIKIIVQQFIKRQIIAEDDRPRFNRIVSSSIRLRNSIPIEIFLLLFVYTVGHWISIEFSSLNVSTWYATRINDIIHLTPAGYWYVFISLPLFQFILVRWYFRIFVWYRFLWQVSKLPLHLNSLHPDHAGGLGFLGTSVYAFAAFLLAHTVLLSGMILNRILNTGATLPQFEIEILAMIIFLVILPIVPMFFFIFKLAGVKRSGTMEYGAVATRYVDHFRQKWIAPQPKNTDMMLGSSDIQSLADLANSYDVSSQMLIIPCGRKTVISLFILSTLPLIPLILTMIPIEEILHRAIKIVF